MEPIIHLFRKMRCAVPGFEVYLVVTACIAAGLALVYVGSSLLGTSTSRASGAIIAPTAAAVGSVGKGKTLTGPPPPAAGPTEPPVRPQEGCLAPDFAVKTMQGGVVRLMDFRGKRVLLNFWATWCSHCQAEMAEMETAYVRHADDDFVVLAIDYLESPDKIERFLQHKGLTFPVGLDTGGQIAAWYQVSGLPTSFFIGRDGVVVKRIMGPVSLSEIEELLNQVP